MVIQDLQLTVVGSPWRELTFVELVTDEGLVGTGEVRMVNKTDTLLACLREMFDRCVRGTDPFEVERLAWRIQWDDYGRPGEVTQSTLAAFDVACWDLIGQALNVPVWKLLGGSMRDAVPAYANGWYQAEREPQTIARLAADVVRRGYKALKLDPFGAAASELEPQERTRALDIVAAVRDAVGPDVQLMIEMHGRFTPSAAAGLARDLESVSPEWLEEPVPPGNTTGLRRVRLASPLPIATGERIHTVPEFRDLLEEGLVDVVQADLTHIGGFTGLRRLAAWAEAYGVTLAPHNVCGPVGTAAAVHFAVATPNVKILEHFNDFADPWVAELVDRPPTVDRGTGCFALPTGPGLGLALDHAACAAHPRSGGKLALFEEGWERRQAPPSMTAARGDEEH